MDIYTSQLKIWRPDHAQSILVIQQSMTSYVDAMHKTRALSTPSDTEGKAKKYTQIMKHAQTNKTSQDIMSLIH